MFCHHRLRRLLESRRQDGVLAFGVAPRSLRVGGARGERVIRLLRQTRLLLGGFQPRRQRHSARVRLHAPHHARRLGRLSLGVARATLRLLGSSDRAFGVFPRQTRLRLERRISFGGFQSGGFKRAPRVGGGGVARGGHLGGARRRDARGFQVGAFERLARIVQLRLEVFDPRGERLRLRERRGGRERQRLRLRRVARALRLLGARRRRLRRRRRLGEFVSQRGERVVSVVRAPRERRDARLGVRQRALRVVQRRRRRVAPTLRLLGARRGRLRRVQRVVALEHQARAHELRLAFRLRHGHLAGKHGVFR